MKIHHSQPFFDEVDETSLIQVLRSRYISSGKRAAFLGKCVAGILEKRWALPVQSGTDALSAALRIMDLKGNSKVAVPAYVCSAPLDAIAISGLSPVPVDIDRSTLAMDPDLVNQQADVSAVIGAHLFGIPAPFHKIENRNLIEDCAQTLGAKTEGRTVGSIGRIAICSFYATKLLTTGHGGALAGNDMKLFERAVDLFDHDKREEWEPHLHFRMSDLNAALGISQLGKLGNFIAERRRIAARYSLALGQGKTADGIFSRFLVVSEKRDAAELAGLFERSGIEAKRPVYKPVFMYLGEPAGKFPNASWAHRKIVSVPLYPGMKESQIGKIEKFLEKHKHDLRCWPPA
ncbi:MAG: DegT/DnrJ/EryC1/StrS family aminotransferase [Victivallales bacterium]